MRTSNSLTHKEVVLDTSYVNFYLDWVNDWLTTSSMAEHYGISIDECVKRINAGRDQHIWQIAEKASKKII